MRGATLPLQPFSYSVGALRLGSLRAPAHPQQLLSHRPLHTTSCLASHTAHRNGRLRSHKVWDSADEAIHDIQSGTTVLSAGFGLCGTAETLITAISRRPDLQNLTVVSNNAGTSGDGGLSPLIKTGQITSMILSYVGSNKVLEQEYLQGRISLELCPQGTLAERIACGGKASQGSTPQPAPAENIVEIGEIHPMDVSLPGIYVDRIVLATVESKIEIITTSPSQSTSSNSSTPSPDSTPALTGEKLAARLRREKIAKRAAKELKDGYYCNLGIGMPTLAVSYLHPGVKVWLQSENGILGMGPFPSADKVDGDIVNAGKETVTLVPGASVFDSVESFGMIRGGHVDVSILGAMEISACGDLASYSIPGKLVRGMGGAMDLVSNPDATKIIVTTDHLDKHGHSKIKQHCTLPLTGSRVVSRIITNLCVFDVDRVEGILTLVELADGITVEDVRVQTEATFVVAPVIGRMESED